MRNLNIIYLAFLLTFACHSSFGQMDDCLLYEKILLRLDSLHKEIKYYYEISFENDSAYTETRVEYKHPKFLSFFVVQRTLRLTERHAHGWFAELMGDTTLTKLRFISNERDSVINCSFNNVVYQFTDWRTAALFDSDTLSRFSVQDSDTLLCRYRGILFSNALFSPEGYAVIYMLLSRGSSFQREGGYIFEKQAGNWHLKTVVHRSK